MADVTLPPHARPAEDLTVPTRAKLPSQTP